MNGNEVTFGIEIECFVPNRYRSSITVGRYHNGIDITFSPYSGWNAQHDGSLRGPSGYFPVEVVSPPMSGEDGLAQIWRMIDILNSMGAKINNTCGLHVHAGARGLGERELANIKRAFVAYETAFFASSGSDALRRWGNNYCPNYAIWTLSPYPSRYRSYNEQNLNRAEQSTLEIRCFAGTLDPRDILSHVYMVVAMVAHESRRDNRRGRIRVHDPIKSMVRFCELYMLDSDNWVIPDEPPVDVCEHLGQKAIESVDNHSGREWINQIVNTFAFFERNNYRVTGIDVTVDGIPIRIV